MSFEPFAKISRLSRPIIITEKLDGSNGQIYIQTPREYDEERIHEGSIMDEVQDAVIDTGEFIVRVGSRKRWLGPAKSEDHFNMFKWVHENVDEIVETLGAGRHYGEWWGQGIQRGYGLNEKRFSLFNTHRWAQLPVESCLHCVPVIGTSSEFDTAAVDFALNILSTTGSHAAPGFMNPEGVVVYHPHGNTLMKKTYKGDDEYVPGKQRAD